MKSRILIIAIGALASASALSAQGLINMAQRSKSSAQSAADKAQNAAQQQIRWQVQGKIDEHAYPLHAAVQKGDLAKVKELIAAGTNLNAKYKNGQTALIWAAMYDNPEIFTSLLKAGADVNAKDNDGRTALMSARLPEVITLLIKAGANVNVTDQLGSTLLGEAAQRNDTEIVALLLKAGANVNTKDSYEKTALDLVNKTAKQYPNEDCSKTKKLLIDAGAK